MKVTIDEKTAREAIEIFKGIEDVRGNLPEDGNDVEEAFYIAIKALEKQIPTESYVEGDGYDDSGNLNYDTWYCPNCNTKYELCYEEYKYCPNCGQCIDLSEWSVK